MLKTDCSMKFEIVCEGKARNRIEIDEKLYTVEGVNPEFGYQTGFINIRKEDGTELKGIVVALFFKE